MPGKSSPVYWHDRKVQYDESLGKDEKRLYSKLAAYYDREAARLDKEIAAYYTRYGVNGVLSYRNLLETLSDADKRLLMERLDDFVQKYPEYADLVPVRESIYKLNRLEGLRQSIAMQQLEMGAYEQAQALAFFQRQALRYANGAASFLGLGSSFYRLDSALIRTAVGNKWCDGKDFSERIWDNRVKLGNTLHTQFVNGVIRGDDYHQLARQIREKFTQVSQKNAERLAFTEDTYLSNEAAMLAFAQEASYTEYEFVCTGDSESCDICKALSGERFKIAERTPGLNFPPMHPWCRCFFTPVVPSLDTLREDKQKEAASREKQDAILLTDSQSSDIIKTDERFEIHPDKIKKFLLKPDAKHSKEFFDVGYTPDDYELLFDDIAANFDMSTAFARIEKPNGSVEFCMYMDLGVTKKRNFRVVWRKDSPKSKPRLITAHREGKKHV